MLDVDKTRKAVRLWKYAAWSLPLIALALVLSAWFFGYQTLEEIIVLIIIGTFASAMFIWWWWATFTIYDVVQATDDRLKKLNQVNSKLGKPGEIMRKIRLRRNKK